MPNYLARITQNHSLLTVLNEKCRQLAWKLRSHILPFIPFGDRVLKVDVTVKVYAIHYTSQSTGPIIVFLIT